MLGVHYSVTQLSEDGTVQLIHSLIFLTIICSPSKQFNEGGAPTNIVVSSLLSGRN